MMLAAITLVSLLAIAPPDSGPGGQAAAPPPSDPLPGTQVVLDTGSAHAPALPLDAVARFNSIQGWTFGGWDDDDDGGGESGGYRGPGLYAHRSDQQQITVAHLAEPGRKPRPVATLEHVAQIGPWSPAGGPPAFLFVSDQDGDERYHIHHHDLTTGISRPLTSGPSRNALPIWAGNGQTIAFTSDRRNGVSSDVYLMPVEDGGKPIMVASRGALIPHDWSPDGALLAVQDFHSVNASRFYIFDLRRNNLHELNAEARGPVAYGKGLFAHSSRGLFLMTDQGGEFTRLEYYKINRRTGFHPTRITRYETVSETPDWDVTDFDLSPDGRWVAWQVNENGYDVLFIRDLGRGRTRRVSELPAGLIHGLAFSPDSRQLALTLIAPSQPETVWTVSPRGMQVRPWTDAASTPAGIEPELHRYPVPAASGEQPGGAREVPVFTFLPDQAGPHPVVIWLHGGPESQFRPGFHPRIQHWAGQLGVAVVAPNVRGSTGYGRVYSRADNGVRREDSLDDIGALLDWIDAHDDLDQRRVCVYGSSYGGFLAMTAMARWPKRLRCGMELAGITDFNDFLTHTSPGRRQLRRFEYGDEREAKTADLFERLSPLNQVARIQAPVLIAHGRNDSRVPFSQSRRFALALRQQGNTVWTLFADNEGHSWLKPANRDVLDAGMAAFLREHLLGHPARRD